MRVALTLALLGLGGHAVAGSPAPPSIPEPGILGLLGLAAVIGIVAARRRK